MKEKEIHKIIDKLVSNRELETAERLLENYLEVNPYDVDEWNRLIILETLSPLEDYGRASEYLYSALSYHKDNKLFFVLLVFFTDWYLGGLDEALVKKAMEIKNTADMETSSMLSYLLACHFRSEDINKYELLLNESIQKYPNYVYNYTDLGEFYLKMGKRELGKNLIREGLSHVKLIYKNDAINDYDDDPLDIFQFVNERITGVFMMEDTYNSLNELLQK